MTEPNITDLIAELMEASKACDQGLAPAPDALERYQQAIAALLARNIDFVYGKTPTAEALRQLEDTSSAKIKARYLPQLYYKVVVGLANMEEAEAFHKLSYHGIDTKKLGDTDRSWKP